MEAVTAYPEAASARADWIVSRRGPKNPVSARIPYGFFVETEPGPVEVSTILLTNRECPWKCLMCDLWRNTLDQKVGSGDIPEQIRYALARLPATRELKLYNSGSFFDPQAIPQSDWPEIAGLAKPFERLIVENHPALVHDRAVRFQRMLGPRLQVALGLETVHPEILEKLNKQSTVADFKKAADYLRQHDIELRVFVLIKPPFMAEHEAAHWALESVRAAQASGAEMISLIPTRMGNGAMEALNFEPPTLRLIEDVFDAAFSPGACQVQLDLWDLEKFSECEKCFQARRERLEIMNLTQNRTARICCAICETVV